MLRLEAVNLEEFCKKGFLKEFAKFTAKQLSQSQLYWINFIEKEALAQVFSCEFCESCKNNVFIEHVQRLLLLHYPWDSLLMVFSFSKWYAGLTMLVINKMMDMLVFYPLNKFKITDTRFWFNPNHTKTRKLILIFFSTLINNLRFLSNCFPPCKITDFLLPITRSGNFYS